VIGINGMAHVILRPPSHASDQAIRRA
jgi:hypothetical protein